MSTTSIAPVQGRPGRRKGSGKRAGADSEWGLRAVQALADPSRWRIVRELSNGARTMRELADRVDLSAACVTHHISILKEVELVDTEREARSVRCRLAEPGGRAGKLLDLVLKVRNVSNDGSSVIHHSKPVEDFLF